MPLVLDFKHGDKMIVNGAVLENSGHNTQVILHNDAAVLRGKDVLTEEDVSTPALRTYFALQCAYIFPSRRDHYLEVFRGFLDDYLTACPSAAEIGAGIQRKLTEGSIYGALRAARKLIDHESALMGELGLAVTKEGFVAAPAAPKKQSRDKR